MRGRNILSTRSALLTGFGGVLSLMLFAGVDSARAIGRIRTREQDIRRDYSIRNQLLSQIRADLYLSGTYIRDFLLEPESARAETHRADLEATRLRMGTALTDYERILTPNERVPFDGLKRELSAYWRLLNPLFRWTADQRRREGYPFLRDDVFPRRTAMLDIAGQIASINEKLLRAGEDSVEGLFSGFLRRIVITVLVTMGLGVLLAAFSIRQTLRLETEAAARYAEIVQARKKLQELSASLVAAQENERRAIARELHDEVGQSLSAVLVELGNLSAAVPAQAWPEGRRHADTIRGLVENSVAVLRNMSLLLRPSMLDDLGLVPALEFQARETSRRSGVRVSVSADGVPDDLPESHKTCIYRVVQEALHNVVRHAGARRVRITVHQQADAIGLEVEDDGKGFDAVRHKGLGLLGMEERVAHLDGRFRIESQPGKGTRIVVAVPLLAERIEQEGGQS